MIRCTIELLPGGNESRARTIGLVEITNVKMNGDGTANYAVVLTKTPPFRDALRAAWRKGKLTGIRVLDEIEPGEDAEHIFVMVPGHHRTRLGSYDLLYRALAACGLAERNSR